MIPKGLFTQIGMVIFSIAIIFTYVRPTFTEIEEIQSEIQRYDDESKKVQSVNSQLAALVTQMESVTQADRQKLLTYMPDEVDIISVKRDLLQISEDSGVIFEGTSEEGAGKKTKRSNTTDSSTDIKPVEHEVILNVVGDYGQIKRVFSAIERNNYPLEVRYVDLSTSDAGLLTGTIEMVTYSFNNQGAAATNNQ